MLISCPKCHSIYEIPDELVGKTGQNFRCHACSNVWHVMREDALGYEDENQDEAPYVEAIPVSEPPHRHYPANKEEYKIPADSKSGRHTPSSQELLTNEADPEYIPPKPKQKKELTLTSDYGTSFTINAQPEEEPEDKNTPHLTETSEDLHITKEDSLLPDGNPCFVFPVPGNPFRRSAWFEAWTSSYSREQLFAAVRAVLRRLERIVF